MSSQNNAPRTLGNIAFVLGVLSTTAAVIGVLFGDREFYPAYLFAYIFWLGISLGCIFMLMLHYLSGGAWGVLTRRIFEAGAGALPLMIVLFVPVIFGISDLYVWDRPQSARPHELAHQAIYLNPPFFIVRAVIYFIIWGFFSYYYRTLSLKQDSTRDPGPTVKLECISGIGMVVLILTVSFAYMDWLMSIEPEWFSSVFPAMVFSGQVMAAMAFAITIVSLLMPNTPVGKAAVPNRLNDLGTILFTLVFFSAYLGYSQLIIMWAGNLKMEIPWYLIRIAGAWKYVAGAIFSFHVVVPFFLLLFRRIKRNIRALTQVALITFFSEALNAYWLIAPEYHHSGPEFHWLYIVTFIGIGGLWLGLYFWLLMRHPLLPLQGKAHPETEKLEMEPA